MRTTPGPAPRSPVDQEPANPGGANPGPANVLLFIVDQWPANLFSHAGGWFETPAVDAIARNGARFSNAFTTCPLCTPARASLLTGRWPSQSGVTDNYGIGYSTQAPLSLEQPTWIDAAVAAGFHVGYFGKWHLGPDGPIARGCHRHPERIEAGLRAYHPGDPSVGYPQTVELYRAQQRSLIEGRAPFWGVVDKAEAELPPRKLADEGVGFLDEFSTSVESAPFFLALSFHSPHFPHYLPPARAAQARSTDVPLPDTLSDRLRGKPWWHKEAWWPSMDTTAFSDAEWRTIVQFAGAHMAMVDECIGIVTRRLQELGLAENTYLVFVSDHGDTGGSHGRFDKGAYFYDEVWRIPLLVAGPGVSAGEARDFVSIADLGATLFDLAGGEARRLTPRDGTTLRPLLEQPDRRGEGSGFAFGRYDSYNGMSFAIRAIRDERFTYVYNPQGRDELYDNREDPGQVENRAADGTLRAERLRLRWELDAWMDDLRDDLPARATELPPAGTILSTGAPGP